MTTFSYEMPDSKGLIPNPQTIGAVLTHANGKQYTIVGFAWLGETDEWGYRHVSPEGVEVVRPLSHLNGKRRDGSPRYKQIDWD